MIWRLIFIAELLLFATPVGVFSLSGAWYVLGRWGEVDALPLLAFLALSYIGLIGFGWLSARFLAFGTTGLVTAKPAWWAAAAIGFLTVVAGTIGFFVGGHPIISCGIVGFPIFIPLLHLFVCKIAGERANNSFKPKPLRGSA